VHVPTTLQLASQDRKRADVSERAPFGAIGRKVF
jgi:hypothetical protein